MRSVASHGYRFYHYAPKADPNVRENWRARWPDAEAEHLRRFGNACRDEGVRFGIGLTPLGLAEDDDGDGLGALAERLAQLDDIGIDDLLLAFDDVRGDAPGLAVRQARLVHWAAARTRADRVFVCPTYYADDALLDRLFGAGPPGYLRELGRRLDPAIRIYWAGEEVCARQHTTGHLDAVAESLDRRPVLWDNYPVNDGPRMSRHLHLRGFTGRPADLTGHLDAHAINPALQPTLSCIPALTLDDSYRLGPDYAYMAATRRAAQSVLGDALASQVMADLPLLTDAGLDRLTDQDRATLQQHYADFDHPAAREILDWLDGAYEAAAPTETG